MSIRVATYALMHRFGAAHRSRLLAVLPELICTAGLLAMIADTATGAGSRADLALSDIVIAVWGIFVVVYALRIWSASAAPKPYAASAARRAVQLHAVGRRFDRSLGRALASGGLALWPAATRRAAIHQSSGRSSTSSDPAACHCSCACCGARCRRWSPSWRCSSSCCWSRRPLPICSSARYSRRPFAASRTPSGGRS